MIKLFKRFRKKEKPASDLLTVFEIAEPDMLMGMSEKERKQRAVYTKNTCIIDNKHFFILGTIPFPVLETRKSIKGKAWVEISEENFYKIKSNWEEKGPPNLTTYRGGPLANEIPMYENSLGIYAILHMYRGEGPMIDVVPSRHIPIAADQFNGITKERAIELIEARIREKAT